MHAKRETGGVRLRKKPTAEAFQHRLWEVDALRGLAVVLMIIFHFTWDLQFFGLVAVDVFSRPWQIFARGIGTAFIFLLGLSLALLHQRGRLGLRYVLWRAGLLLGLGTLISLATYGFVGDSYVRFGILHLLGVSVLLVLPFPGVPAWQSMLAGTGLIVVGALLNHTAAPFPWLIWLGVPQAGVTMVDYYPLLPWFGVALIGVAVGRMGFRDGRRAYPLPALGGSPPIRALSWLGQHSLPIYLLHQPLLIGVLIALGAVAS
jgi:uncharacterized membrane protein